MFCPNPGLGLNKTRVCPTPYPHRHAPGSQNCPFTDPLFSFRVRRARVTHGLLRDAILNFQGKLWFRGCLPLRSKTHNKTRILIETSAYWATYLFLTGYLALKLLIILSANQVQTWSTVTESLTFDRVSVSVHEPKLGHFRRRFPNKIGTKMMQITQGSL